MNFSLPLELFAGTDVHQGTDFTPEGFLKGLFLASHLHIRC